MPAASAGTSAAAVQISFQVPKLSAGRDWTADGGGGGGHLLFDTAAAVGRSGIVAIALVMPAAAVVGNDDGGNRTGDTLHSANSCCYPFNLFPN